MPIYNGVLFAIKEWKNGFRPANINGVDKQMQEWVISNANGVDKQMHKQMQEWLISNANG